MTQESTPGAPELPTAPQSPAEPVAHIYYVRRDHLALVYPHDEIDLVVRQDKLTEDWIPLYTSPQPQPEAREALAELVKCFPTDTDMAQAGWNGHEIEAACKAYDRARAALAAQEPVANVDARIWELQQAYDACLPYAKRYDWLRNNATTIFYQEEGKESPPAWADILDRQIDAAMGNPTDPPLEGVQAREGER